MCSKLLLLLVLGFLFLFSPNSYSAVLQSYETGQDAALEIGCGGGGCATRERLGAQSFQLDNDATITSVDLYLQANTGADDIVIRIETDSGSLPSTTLADVNATCTIAQANVPGTYDFETCTFSTPFDLTASTSYWIVARRSSGDSGGADENYLWGTDNSSPTYTNGEAKQSDNDYSSGANWSGTGRDALFRVNGDEASTFTPKAIWF